MSSFAEISLDESRRLCVRQGTALSQTMFMNFRAEQLVTVKGTFTEQRAGSAPSTTEAHLPSAHTHPCHCCPLMVSGSVGQSARASRAASATASPSHTGANTL